MSVLILSLFNGILLFRQRTEQSVLYHVCPDAEGLGGTLNSALLKVGLAKKEMPCRLLVVFREIQCVSRSQCRLLNFIQFSASDGEGNGGVIQHPECLCRRGRKCRYNKGHIHAYRLF